MQLEIQDAILKILSGIAIAVAAAWVTVYLSRNKFRSERLWERKAEAYERVIEAFHKSKKVFSERLDTEMGEGPVSTERDAQLTRMAQEAREEVSRTADIGSFLLSDKAVWIVIRYQSNAKSLEDCHTLADYLDEGWALTNLNLGEFIAEAKLDLQPKSLIP